MDSVLRHHDAVLVLGPAKQARTVLGRPLVTPSVVETLAVSVPWHDYLAPVGEQDVAICDDNSLRIICFVADPETRHLNSRIHLLDARSRKDAHDGSVRRHDTGAHRPLPRTTECASPTTAIDFASPYAVEPDGPTAAKSRCRTLGSGLPGTGARQ